jgi:molybdenum cofactor biosynthesis protein MoaC
MIDVSPKFNTLRYARAEGFLHGTPDVLDRIRTKTVPKGDVLEVARAAGILAAKRCSEWIVFCHPIPIDWVGLDIAVKNDILHVSAEVKSVWKTGVEMEALTAVTAALLNAYDMLKPLDDHLVIGETRVVEKRGGKSDFNKAPSQSVTTAILVISDSTFAGNREDTAGRAIQEFLKKQPVSSAFYEVLPDDAKQIADRLTELVDDENVSLIFTCGGTGLGPRDVTVEATKRVVEKDVPGISEAIRNHGKTRTPYAMLSRGLAGVRGKSLIINLPGSLKGAKESLEALFPGLLHIFSMIQGEGHN